MSAEASLPIEARGRPSALVSLLLYVGAVGFMWWLRLVVFGHELVALTYGVPMLLCLWHRDRRLLIALAGTFAFMATYKLFYVLPPALADRIDLRAQWIMQMVNIGLIGGVIHGLMVTRARLEGANASLTTTNRALLRREEEIVAQNEELQQQATELQSQNEELQRQTEEIRVQSEELTRQADEMHALHQQQTHRERILEALLHSLHSPDPGEDLAAVCRALVPLVAGDAAALVIRDGEDLHVRAAAADDTNTRIPFARSVASIVMEHGKPAFVDDLFERPDLRTPFAGQPFRSVLSAPIVVPGGPVGALEVYARAPRRWTTDEFRAAAWAADHCAVLLQIGLLQEKVEAANRHLEGEVAARTRDLSSAVEELEHFSHTITHDMRAPLRAMNGFARLLAEDPALPEAERREYLARIVTAGKRLDRLIVDALEYSRSDRHGAPAVHDVDPARLLDGMLATYPDLAAARHQIEVVAPLPLVRANEGGLTQCLSNLLSNALKFVEAGRVATVRVGGEAAGAWVRLWVEDDGIGVPDEMHARIFGLFQRVDRSYEGTGLGLALVKKVVERMGGRVGVQSRPSGGSRFWIELPRAQEGSS